ncbi:hypothetical protein ACF065_06790 [Streptomyces sp. NPDC015232]|uniref:hypothetical protein n=1 Tax=unclassified Streptomyces TaxID=2593676 RepID=UPI003701290E
MSRARRPVAVLVLAGALLAALPACAPSVDPFERLGRKAAERVGPGHHHAVRHQAPAAQEAPHVAPRSAPRSVPREGARHATGS